jgi:hypothetical protein
VELFEDRDGASCFVYHHPSVIPHLAFRDLFAVAVACALELASGDRREPCDGIV